MAPGFRSGYMGVTLGQAQGQPAVLKPWFDFWINLQHSRALPFPYLVAVVETLIALAVIAGFARKLTYIAAAGFSLLIWATAEGGGPYTSGSSDIGTGIIYAVFFLGLLALSAYSGPAHYSVDYYLEKKISWWWKVAEVRRPVPDQPAAAAPVPAHAAALAPATVPAQAAGLAPATVPSRGQPSRPSQPRSAHPEQPDTCPTNRQYPARWRISCSTTGFPR